MDVYQITVTGSYGVNPPHPKLQTPDPLPPNSKLLTPHPKLQTPDPLTPNSKLLTPSPQTIGVNDFKEDLLSLFQRAAVKGQPTSFILVDSQARTPYNRLVF